MRYRLWSMSIFMAVNASRAEKELWRNFQMVRLRQMRSGQSRTETSAQATKDVASCRHRRRALPTFRVYVLLRTSRGGPNFARRAGLQPNHAMDHAAINLSALRSPSLA